MHKYRIYLLCIAIMLPFTPEAKKTRLKLPVDKKPSAEIEMAKGSQAISTECVTCGDGYTLADVSFSGYDKKASSEKESFFIINRSDRELTGVSLYIVYLTTDSVQLHRRWAKINCSIPPGETGKVDIRSWDTQNSFYYYRSDPPRRRRATPYMVRFEPVTIYLRFK